MRGRFFVRFAVDKPYFYSARRKLQSRFRTGKSRAYYGNAAHFNGIRAAFGAFFARERIERREFTFGISGATVESRFCGCYLFKRFAAFGAFAVIAARVRRNRAADLFDIVTFRVARASPEITVLTLFYNHRSAAFIADFGFLVRIYGCDGDGCVRILACGAERKTVLGGGRRHGRRWFFGFDRLGVFTFREVRAGKKFTEFTRPDNHLSAAFVADYVRLFVGGFKRKTVAYRGGNFIFETVVKIGYYFLPYLAAEFDVVEFFFHVRGKSDVHNVGKVFYEHIDYVFAEFGRL